MTHQPTTLTPDFEEHNRLTVALLEHLGLDLTGVEYDSITIHLAGDRRHLVTWTGVARITTEQLATITRLADAKHDAR